MNQQINLYQPIFRKEKIVFSAQTIFWLSFGFLVLLLLWSFLISQRVGRLEAEYERQLAAEARAVEQLTELRRNTPPTEPGIELQETVERLDQHRTSLHQSLNALDRIVPAAEVDLSRRIDALARQIPEGLWLTRLELGDNGDRLVLHGRALAAPLVPRFIDALSAEPLMSGLGFSQVHVRAASDEIPGVVFTISTEPEPQS